VLVLDRGGLYRLTREETSKLEERVKGLKSEYHFVITYIDPGHISIFHGDSDDDKHIKLEHPLKPYEKHILASFITSLISRGIDAYLAPLIASSIYNETRKQLYDDLGALYTFDELLLYLREFIAGL